MLTPIPTLYLTEWDKRFFHLADHVASWSKDPTTKVGCVISSPYHRILGTGYNGFPHGTDDSAVILEDRPRKRLRTIHAELNAIHFSNGLLEGSSFYVTHHPCSGCAASIIQHQPLAVMTYPPTTLHGDWEASTMEAIELFKESGVLLLYRIGGTFVLPENWLKDRDGKND
jgi:dCMP deaminase